MGSQILPYFKNLPEYTLVMIPPTQSFFFFLGGGGGGGGGCCRHKRVKGAVSVTHLSG